MSAPASRYHYPSAFWRSFYDGGFYANAVRHWGWKDILPCVTILGWLSLLALAFDPVSPDTTGVMRQLDMLPEATGGVISQLELAIAFGGKWVLPLLLVLMPFFVWIGAFFGAFIVSIPASLLKTPLALHDRFIIALLSYIPYQLADWAVTLYHGIKTTALQASPATPEQLLLELGRMDFSMAGTMKSIVIGLIPFAYMCFAVWSIRRQKTLQAGSYAEGEGI